MPAESFMKQSNDKTSGDRFSDNHICIGPCISNNINAIISPMDFPRTMLFLLMATALSFRSHVFADWCIDVWYATCECTFSQFFTNYIDFLISY